MNVEELLIKEKYDEKEHEICLIPVKNGQPCIPFTFMKQYSLKSEVVKYKWNNSKKLCYGLDGKFRGEDSKPTLIIYWLFK